LTVRLIYKPDSGISLPINLAELSQKELIAGSRVSKGLKWQAFGYRDMDYFILKILQRCGCLGNQETN